MLWFLGHFISNFECRPISKPSVEEITLPVSRTCNLADI